MTVRVAGDADLLKPVAEFVHGAQQSERVLVRTHRRGEVACDDERLPDAGVVGVEGELRFWGGSHVVDPWGNVVAAATEGVEHLLTDDIDLDDVRTRRRQIPLVKEARLGLIGREIARLLDEGGDL